MGTTRYKPSKPAAVVGIVMGIGLLIFGITNFGDSGEARGFLIFWCVMVVAVTGLHTWAAFSKKGSLATFVSTDEEK